MQQQRRFSAGKAVAVLACACAGAALWFCLAYHFDNKYTAKAPCAQGAAAVGGAGAPVFLVDGWELYPDQLLTPQALAAGDAGPGYRVWLGEYPNLAAFHADGAPYGTATYRLRLVGSGDFSLLLPEALCAARVYWNGELLGAQGVPAADGAYRPLVRDGVYALALAGEGELVIETANYSHYYGGLYYPPAVGSPDAIARLVASRMVFYGLLCFSSLALALFSLAVWRGAQGQRDSAAFYFGLLCLSFALRVAYPFFRMAGAPLVRLLYAAEDAAALLGLYCAVRIVLLLCPLPAGPARLAGAAALGMCWAGAAVPLLVLPFFPAFTPVYGLLVSWYKLAAALFLLGAALRGALRGRAHSLWLLAGVAVYGACLFFTVFFTNRYEPIYTGWPDESGSFVLVVLFGVLMARRSRALARENRYLNRHLQQEVDARTQYLTLLLRERKDLMAELVHDVRSPLTSLLNFAHLVETNDILLDDETRAGMRAIEEKCGALAGRLRSFQELSREAGGAQLAPLSLSALLAQFYRDNKPVVELSGPDLALRPARQELWVRGDREKLLRVLENLMYNAVDFTPPTGRITLSLARDGPEAVLCVRDTGCGMPPEVLAHAFDRFYTTRAEAGGQGLGLAIAKAAALEHGGTLTASSPPEGGAVFTLRLPLLEELA